MKIDTKAIKDSLGNAITSGGLKANTPYTFCYESTSSSFILLGKGGGGDATAAQLLLGKKATVDSGQIVGTLDLTNLVTGNIKSGVTINGISGKASVVDTSDALATAAQILSGASAYAGGVKIAGNIPNNYGVWQYSGVPGATNGRLHMYPPKGYYDPAGGTGIYYDSPDYLTENIISGKNIFGMVGNATIASLGGKQFASGSAKASFNTVAFTGISGGSAGSYSITVTGLTFTPSIIFARCTVSNAVSILVPSGYTAYSGPCVLVNRDSNSTNYKVKGDVSSCVLSYGTFTIPVTDSYQVASDYVWFAVS